MNRLAKSILLGMLILCFSIVGYAESSEIKPRASEILHTCRTDLTVDGNSATATVYVSAYNTCDKVGVLSIKIQEKRDGSWVTVASTYSQYAYDASYHTDYLTYNNVKDGMQYRATATFYAQDGSTTDSRTSTSNTCTA